MAVYEFANPFTSPPAGGCQPGLTELWRWLQASYDSAIRAGCYADRPISGATAPSLHRDGRALDVNFGRPEQFTVALMELVLVGERLGVQQILDYRGDRSWRPGRGFRYWRAPVGRSHLHIEMTRAAAADRRPIVERLRPVLPPMPSPPPPLPTPSWEDDDMATTVSRTVPCGADGKGWAPLGVSPDRVIGEPWVVLPHAFRETLPEARLFVATDGNACIHVTGWFPGTHLEVRARVA